ncbi:MAG: bifunctional demethylmenaquinone methyltransferase/2-methoxy-6-polyprenyl-1,4-benzoquinol methylase UbiE [Bacteroidia bacterium]|nr:bifunctional demethylmenaquinone methyltransferase/2-methoxy-6-polyprenyl-1,4-benzoquinol methylase UbiE [Bacteroidia bacterium]
MGTPVTPYQRSDSSKKQQVTEMFDNIAPKYDLLNHALSFGVDILWRRRAVNMLQAYQPKIVVDLATGTGDFAVEARKLKPEQIIGIDISPNMLEVGRQKIAEKGLSDLIDMRIGDSEALDLATDSIDAMTVGFGVRNFENLPKGLSEMCRVLKPGKAAIVLEPSFPTQFPMKQLFQFHFKVLTPLIGRFISGDVAAYNYLPESVRAFPNGEEFCRICREAGFSKAEYQPLSFGICSLYLLEK